MSIHHQARRLIASQPQWSWGIASLLVLVIVIVGVKLIFFSHAGSTATWISVEAESGNRTTGATLASDNNASGGQYVLFGATPTPTPTPTPAPTPTPSPGSGALLGLWSGSSLSDTQLGVTQQLLIDFASPGGSSGTFTTYSVPSTSLRIVLAIGALNSSQASTIGNALVKAGHADTIFRVMVEQNQGTWNTAWNEKTFSAAQFIAAFQADVNNLRAVPGNQFTFAWNPNGDDGNNISGRTTEDTYPGDAYVDYIGTDIYDWYGGTLNGNESEILAFGKAHNKPYVLPEWGLNTSDDTTFMNNIISFIKNSANNVYLQSYFSCPMSECPSPNSDLTHWPNSRAVYTAAFK